jgi:hypothetical protein
MGKRNRRRRVLRKVTAILFAQRRGFDEVKTRRGALSSKKAITAKTLIKKKRRTDVSCSMAVLYPGRHELCQAHRTSSSRRAGERWSGKNLGKVRFPLQLLAQVLFAAVGKGLSGVHKAPRRPKVAI